MTKENCHRNIFLKFDNFGSFVATEGPIWVKSGNVFQKQVDSNDCVPMMEKKKWQVLVFQPQV